MKKHSIFILLAVLAILMVGCSANGADDYDPGNFFPGRYRQNVNTNGMYASNYMNTFDDVPEEGRFVIAEAHIYLQTRLYESFNKDILAKLEEFDGYVENKTEENQGDGRLGSFTFKVPTEKLDEFSQWIEKNATVISSDISRTDVTNELIETGSRKKALEAEETALLAILEKAETVDDIITVQDRISNVHGELESYAQRLQQLNNQVKYSTVYVNLREVDRITTSSQSFTSLAGSGFMTSVRNIGAGLRNLAIWLVSVSPYIIIGAVVLVPVLLLTKRYVKRRKARIDAGADDANDEGD